MKDSLLYIFLISLIFLSSCTDPIVVGADYLAPDQADLGQSMDIHFTTRVVPEDSLLVYDGTNYRPRYDITYGWIEDDIFGQLIHSNYVTPRLSRLANGTTRKPAFSTDPDRYVDSVVLILGIDTSFAFYGDARNFSVKLDRLFAPIPFDEDAYSDSDFPIGFSQIQGVDEFFATKTATLLFDTVVAPTGDSILRPHIRIPMNQDVIDAFNMADSVKFESDSAFHEIIPGWKMTPTDPTNGLITLQFQDSPNSNLSGLYLFDSQSGGNDPEIYRAPLLNWTARYRNSFSQSLTGDLLLEGLDNEQLSLVGQAGTMIEIKFTNLDELNNLIINRAQMEFHIKTPEGYSYDEFPYPQFLGLYYRNDDGYLLPILDRQRLGSPNISTIVRQFLGGDPLTGEDGEKYYRPRFSLHMQKMIQGEVPPTLYLRAFPLDKEPGRVLLYGPESDVKPATIEITFTRP